MSTLEKRIARIRARPPSADFDDVHRVLEYYGWVRANESGSHVTYKKQGEYPLVVVKEGGRRVKRGYLVMICERLGLDE